MTAYHLLVLQLVHQLAIVGQRTPEDDSPGGQVDPAAQGGRGHQDSEGAVLKS